MRKDYIVVIERDAEGFLIGSVPELPGCHSQAKSLDALMERVREAIELCVHVQDEDVTPEFIGVHRVWV